MIPAQEQALLELVQWLARVQQYSAQHPACAQLGDKTHAAVKERLTKEINYWDHRAEDLKAQEAAGKQPRMNWQMARQRADDLQARLQKRMEELEQERRLSPLPPVAIGGALVVPAGLLARLMGERDTEPEEFARALTLRKERQQQALHACTKLNACRR